MRSLKSLALSACLLVGMAVPCSAVTGGAGGVWYWTSGGQFVSSSTPGTRAGIQTVADLSTPTVRVHVQLGPGTYDLDSTLWLHGNISFKGVGKGITILRRSRFNAADPANTGHVIISAPYGSHSANLGLSGGLPTDSLANIEIADLTIDGNYTSWPSADPNTCGNMGIQFWFVDGVTLRNVEIKNTLQTAVEFDACRNVLMSGFDIHDVGQQTNLGTRNGINVNNNSGSLNASVNWARRTIIEHGTIRDQRDAAIDFANNSEITVSHVDMFNSRMPDAYANYSFEHEGDIAGYTAHDFKIAYINSYGLRNSFYRLAPAANHNVENVDISHFSAYFGTNTTNSAGEALMLGRTTDFYVRHMKIHVGVMTNINAGASTSGAIFCQLGNAGTIASEDIGLTDLYFAGANGGVSNTSNGGVSVYGNIYGLTLDRVHVSGSENVGLWFRHEVASGALRKVIVRDCTVDGAQSAGLIVGSGALAGTTNDVRVINFTAKDTNKAAAGQAVQVTGAVNGQTIKNVLTSGTRLFRTSGTNMQGYRLLQSGTAVVDSVLSEDDDFSSAAAPIYTTSGAPTNVRYGSLLYRIEPTMLAVSDSLRVNKTTELIGNLNVSAGKAVVRDSLRSNGPIRTASDMIVDAPGFKITFNNSSSAAYIAVPNANFRCQIQGTDMLAVATDGVHALSGGALIADGKALVVDTLRVAGRLDMNNSVILREGVNIASAATITIGNSNFYTVTGTTTSTDIAGPAMPAGKHQIVTFYTTAGWQITGGNHWKINGNFNGNATGNKDALTVDWDGTDATEVGRVIQ